MYILVRTGKHFHKVNTDDILYIESDYIISIYLKNSVEPLHTAGILSDIERKLCEEKFFRINRNIIINLLEVDQIGCNGSKDVILTNGKSFNISTRRYSTLKEKISQLIL